MPRLRHLLTLAVAATLSQAPLLQAEELPAAIKKIEAKGDAYPQTESERISKNLAGKVTAERRDAMVIRRNVLNAFKKN